MPWLAKMMHLSAAAITGVTAADILYGNEIRHDDPAYHFLAHAVDLS
ncbi:MAG: hypothetical protein AB1830_15465 [Pseudomonadota bacterium]